MIVKLFKSGLANMTVMNVEIDRYLKAQEEQGYHVVDKTVDVASGMSPGGMISYVLITVWLDKIELNIPDLDGDEGSETSYLVGKRVAIQNILRQCLDELGQAGYDANSWAVERSEVITVLREICGQHGSNDWDDDLYIPDILRKYLQDVLNA